MPPPVCPPPLPNCPFPTPTITPVPRPAEPEYTSAPYQPKFEAGYMSVGSRWMLQPWEATGGASPDYFARGPLPFASSQGTVPNVWSPFSAQATWRVGLWAPEKQAEDFAGRSIIMAGATNSSVGNIESGQDKTRTSGSTWNFDGSQSKYYMGSSSIGTVIRGGSSYDDIRILGSGNYAFMNLYDPSDIEDPNDPNTTRIHAFGMAGVEGFAYPSRRISADLSNGGGPVDPRTGTLHPGDHLDVTPSILGVVIGLSGGSIIDNKRAGFCTPQYTFGTNPPLTQAGYIGSAIGVRATVGSATDGSWINVGSAQGVYTALYFANDLMPATPGHFCAEDGIPDCERQGSTIGIWTGVSVGTPSGSAGSCAPINFGATVGAFIADQTPDDDGGAPLMVAHTIQPAMEVPAMQTERHAAIVTRGKMVMGDSEADPEKHGYDTDVLHIRDVLHLAPRTEPPLIHESTPASERAGLLYFDAKRNALRISVAFPGETEEEANRVAWADIPIDTDSLDVAGADQNAQALAREEIESSLDRARQLAEERTSPFIHPRINPLVTRGVGDVYTVNLLASGFRGTQPRVFWKLEGVGPDRIHETAWEEIVAPVASSAMPDTLSFDLDFAGLLAMAPDNFRHEGRVVKFLAMDPETGQTAGSAERLPQP